MNVLGYAAESAGAPLRLYQFERRDPRPNDAVVDILYCGICHSDMHRVNDDWGNTHFPVVPGHEIIGRVVSRGTRASRFNVGDLVGIGCIVDSCRKCSECRSGREMFCERGVTFSFDSLEEGKKTWTCGGYSTTYVVDERYVLRVPKGLDPARASPLMCGGITTYSPLCQFGCKPGDEVAIVGLGGLGHLAVKLAASMGADVTVLSTSRGEGRRCRSPRSQGLRCNWCSWVTRCACREVQPDSGHSQRHPRSQQGDCTPAELRHPGPGWSATRSQPHRCRCAYPWQQANRG
jgi:uncharacterized zinc-type alcohol dehydrogenase-like protein